MSAWLGFWWTVASIALACYLFVAAIVSVKAFGDVRELLRFLSQGHEEDGNV